MKNKVREVMLFIPGNKPNMFADVILYKPDTVMFDLEDSVSLDEKDAARDLTVALINHYDYQKHNIEVAVRINDLSTPYYLADLKAVVNSKADMIRLPKINNTNELKIIIEDLEKFEKEFSRKNPLVLFCAIESAEGVLNAYDIAKFDKRIVGIALGGVDYLFDIQATRSVSGIELLYARQSLIHAARAAKIDVFDCVYGNVNDTAGFLKEVQFIKQLGFSGKSVIHPKQIKIVKDVYQTSVEELNWAINVIKAYENFDSSKQGVFVYQNKMIDKPYIEYAKKILAKNKR